MKKLLAVLFVAALSVSTSYANMDKDVTRTSAPSDKQSATSTKKNASAQEYVDTAHTGQAAPTRLLDKTGRCRDADGIWLDKNDVGYSSCMSGAKRVEQ